MKAAKPDIAKKHNELLAARYDLADRADAGGEDDARQAGPAGPAREACRTA